MGIETAIAAIGTLGSVIGTGVGVAQALGGNKAAKASNAQTAQARAADAERRKLEAEREKQLAAQKAAENQGPTLAQRNASIFTTPQGILEQATTARKKLLGN